MSYIFADDKGDNSVDAVHKKNDINGSVYYEFRGKNRNNEQRIVRVYEQGLIRYFYVDGVGLEQETTTKGYVHTQIENHLIDILKYFQVNPSFTLPFILADKQGNNFVSSVTRKINSQGQVYYEIYGRNKDNQARIVHIFPNNKMVYFTEQAGKLIVAQRGDVHQQIENQLGNILSHFNALPLNFSPPNKNEKVQELPIKMVVPASIESTTPTKEFIIKAAKRAIDLGDKVASQQTDVHKTRTVMIGTASKYYNEGNTTRLDLFQQLVAGRKDGYYPFAATTAYGLSILTYIAGQYDKLDKTELKRLYHLYRVIAGDIPPLEMGSDSDQYRQALAKGLKAEVNEITALREREHALHHKITTDLAQYNHELIHGNPKGRPIMDKKTSFTQQNTKEVLRVIPSFFPVPIQADSTDQIVLQAGGCKTHSAIVCIWKQAVDAKGNPIQAGDGKIMDRYRVYRTVCNAGFGTTHDVRTKPPALYHEIYSPTPEGKTYSVCTQEVLLGDNVPYTHEAMQKQIEALVNAERQLMMFHDLPGTKGPNGEKGTLNQADQKQWRVLNESIFLGPVVKELSALTQPQTTGNCTVRSIKEYGRWELIRSGATQQEAALILDRHWQFASQNNSASILKLLPVVISEKKNDIKKIGDGSLNLNPSPSKPKVLAINLKQNVKDFFSKPIISKFPAFSTDTASQNEADQLVNHIRTGKIDCPKPTMMKLKDLLEPISAQSKNTQKNALGYHLLVQCDARVVPSFDCLQGAIRQVASQFNSGESPARKLTTPNLFLFDKSQGPAEQRTAGGAAIARFAYSAECDAFSLLCQEPNLKREFDRLFDYQFGYLTPKSGEEKSCVQFLKTHIDKLILNVERVAIDDKPSQRVIQVLNSGLALGLYDNQNRLPENRKYLTQLTEILLIAQYQALATVAILEAQHHLDKRIPLTLTMVGGGVYGNDKTVIVQAISAAIERIKRSGVDNIDICLSIYDPKEVQEYQKIAASDGKFADVLHLLQQKPITQAELAAMKTLPAPSPEPVPAPKPEPVPAPKPEPRPIGKIEYHNEKLLTAMNQAVLSLSQKNHLDDAGQQRKKIQLNEKIKNYQGAVNQEAAKNALLDFLIEASTPRQSYFGRLFTAKFGETATVSAFLKLANDKIAKKTICQAIGLKICNDDYNNVKSKQFIDHLRDHYNPETKNKSHYNRNLRM